MDLIGEDNIIIIIWNIEYFLIWQRRCNLNVNVSYINQVIGAKKIHILKYRSCFAKAVIIGQTYFLNCEWRTNRFW